MQRVDKISVSIFSNRTFLTHCTAFLSSHVCQIWATQISFLLHILRFLFFFPNLKMLNLFEFYLKAWGILMPNTLQRSPLFVVAPIYVVKPKK